MYASYCDVFHFIVVLCDYVVIFEMKSKYYSHILKKIFLNSN